MIPKYPIYRWNEPIDPITIDPNFEQDISTELQGWTCFS